VGTVCRPITAFEAATLAFKVQRLLSKLSAATGLS